MSMLKAHREEDEMPLLELLLEFQSPIRPTRGADVLPHPAGKGSLFSFPPPSDCPPPDIVQNFKVMYV